MSDEIRDNSGLSACLLKLVAQRVGKSDVKGDELPRVKTSHCNDGIIKTGHALSSEKKVF